MKKSVLLAACVAAAMLLGFATFRIYQVNAAYPSQSVRSYNLGEVATYAGENSSGEPVEYGSIEVEAKKFSFIDYENLTSRVKSYTDSLIEEGAAGDMAALCVKVKITNRSPEFARVHVRDFNLESNAWSNGLYAPLYAVFNENTSTIIELLPGDSVERDLVYLIYDIHMNSKAEWLKVNSRNYQMVLALYPDKYSLNLGSPTVYAEERANNVEV